MHYHVKRKKRKFDDVLTKITLHGFLDAECIYKPAAGDQLTAE